jgi:hypothetical protein
VTTHHFAKVAAGDIVDEWDAADFIAAEARLTTFWEAIDGNYTNEIVFKQIRWYRAGPDDVPPQAPVRIVDPNLAGVDATNQIMPPQVAVSVTEKTTDPRAWGRFYLPPPSELAFDTNTGRIATGTLTTLADAADAMYEGLVTDGVPAVVYSSAKPIRETKAGTELPATVARALTVTQIQIDDVADVIRSRRWNEPLLRVQRDIAGA